MFNRSAFNHLRFNQLHEHKTLSAELSATTTVQATGLATLSAQAHLSAESGLRQLTYMSAHLSASGSVTANAGLIMRARSTLSAEGTLIARASKWQRRELVFSGSWLPGQVIEINHRMLTVVLDGQNALHLVQGRFGAFAFGLNEIVYIDAAAARSVLAQIIYQQKQM